MDEDKRCWTVVASIKAGNLNRLKGFGYEVLGDFGFGKVLRDAAEDNL